MEWSIQFTKVILVTHERNLHNPMGEINICIKEKVSEDMKILLQQPKYDK